MIKLSVVIITFNEEKNLERCLSSVIDLADDIVILDCYSTDRTEEIARRFGANFVQHPFDGHIQQKNRAITYAKYPYILSMDADEQLSPQLKKSIYEVKQNWEYEGYYFNRLTSYCGRWIHYTSWYPSRKLRLFNSNAGKWGGFNPHDRFILKKKSSKKVLQGNLLHYSYYSIREHIDRINSFSHIIAKSYFEANRKSRLYDIIFRPFWRFFRDYFFKLGFLDGFYGFVISINSAFETYLKYVLLRTMIKEQKRLEKKRFPG